MHPILNIAISAARKAGDLIIRYIDRLERIIINKHIEEKYFFEIDKKVKDIISQTIHKSYPNHTILTEKEKICYNNFKSIWIIGPLDGIKNYLHRFPFYCISIAYRLKNNIEHAVIYDPVRYEYFTASRGCGAKLNDKKIRVSSNNNLYCSLISINSSFLHNQNINNNYLSEFEILFEKYVTVRKTGSIALDLAYLASGRLDGIIEFFSQSYNISAGSLILQEAGGLISNYAKQNNIKIKNIIAGNPKIFKLLSKISRTF